MIRVTIKDKDGTIKPIRVTPDAIAPTGLIDFLESDDPIIITDLQQEVEWRYKGCHLQVEYVD